MEYELDAVGRAADGERFYVYARIGGKKRCIGQLLVSATSGLWTAYADGEPLAVARTEAEAVDKLLSYVAARDGAGSVAAASDGRPRRRGAGKRTYECTLEERYVRMRRKIPKQSHFTEGVVRQADNVPIERRGRLLREVDELVNDLEVQLLWWRKIRKALSAPPKLVRYK